MNKTIRVIKIIDDMSIILNCGFEDGIKEKDKFKILSDVTQVIIDPFTNEELGKIQKGKALVEATTVYEKMCICENTVRIGGIAESFSEFAKLAGKRASLNVDIEQITGEFSINDKPIKIGDEAKHIE